MVEAADRVKIRELLECWVLWRDAGEWDRFATLWHSDGWMIATWFQARAFDFIVRSKQLSEAGFNVLHSLGGISIDIQATRAIAQSKMQITQRAKVHDVLVDVTCIGRFWDALEKDGGQWKLLLRQPIYDMDRMTPVSPGPIPVLNKDVLEGFPEGYRHLAYLQANSGLNVSKEMPSGRSAAVISLGKRGNAWLQGGSRSDLSPLFGTLPPK